MNKNLLKIRTVLVALAVISLLSFLTGCNRDESTVAGGLMGAGVGAAIGGATKGAVGGGVGAIIGAVGGAVAGNVVGSQNENTRNCCSCGSAKSVKRRRTGVKKGCKCYQKPVCKRVKSTPVRIEEQLKA